MYVKTLKQLSIFAFGFHYERLYPITDFDELCLQTREQIVQWLLDHDTGILDRLHFEKLQADIDSAEAAAAASHSGWHIFHRVGSRKGPPVEPLSPPIMPSPDVELEDIITRCFENTRLFANITRLTVTKSLMLCDELLFCFAQQCGRLKSIHFSRCMAVTDNGVSHLASFGRLRALESLEVENCDRFNGSCLTQIDACDNLTSVTLKFLKLNWKSFHDFLQVNDSIRFVDLRSSSFMGKVEEISEIPALLQQNLISLVLPKTNHKLDLFMTSLCMHCPNIRKLDLTACEVGDIDEVAECCPDLEDLDLTFCVKLKNSYFTEGFPLPAAITNLGLGGLSLSTEMLTNLLESDAFENLTHINLNGVDATAKDTNFIRELCESLGHQLMSVSLNHPELPDIALVPISKHCTALRELAIGGSCQITGETLRDAFINNANHMTKLSLICCINIQHSILTLISEKCRNLYKLDLSKIKAVDDTILFNLSNNCNKELQSIGLGACREVTDAGVMSLAVACHLTKVNLAGIANITNKSVIHLARCCPTLTEFYISGCSKITKDAVTYLRDQCISRVHVSQRNPSVFNCTGKEEEISAYNRDLDQFVVVSGETGIY